MATITNLQGSTQIGNSDEIINQNFQNINNAMVEKTGDQSIAGIKTFTDRNIIQDVTNNTENPYMRVTAHSRKTKNLNNAGGVNFSLYTDADGSLIGNRKLSFRGYLKKRLDGAIATYNELLIIEYDTYDGDTTYTTKTAINTTSFRFQDQNRTGNRTNWTPTRNGGITTGSITVNSATYKQIGKIVTISAYLSFTPSSTGNSISFALPIPGVAYTPISAWLGSNLSTNHCMGWIDSGNITFEQSFTSGVAIQIMFSCTYQAS